MEMVASMREELIRRAHAAVGMGTGWCTANKATHLVDLILETRPKKVVEIGVWGGLSLAAMGIVSREIGAHVVGIDPWSKEAALEGMTSQENLDWWKQQDIEAVFRGCNQLITSWGLGLTVALWRMRGEDAAEYFRDGSIDFLHLDGNHSEEQSRRTAAAYMPKMAPSAVVVFDDVNWVENNVLTQKKAMEEIAAAGFKLIETVRKDRDDYAVYRR